MRRNLMNDRVGQQIGNYRLVQLLGSGGFADVYLGSQVFLDNPAAIKLLHTNLAREDIESFRAEARTLVRLIHPHVIRVLDFGVDANTPFLVMDYAPNGTLRQRHPRGQQLPLARVIEYVRQIASALQYAHDEKIIHRDVKPENLLIGRQQEILLSDFGIAVVAQSTLTQLTQELTGTAAYMAPEQIQGHARPASDQYALGIVAYEWLSGTTPFTGTFTELTFKHIMAPVPSLRAQVPGLPPAVEQVILTALAKDPAQRFRSVRAFAAALEQASIYGVSSPFPQVSPAQAAPLTPILPLLSAEPARFAQIPGHTETTIPPTMPVQPGRYPPTPPGSALVGKREVSRRTVLVTGLSAAGLLAVGSGIAWQVISHSGSSRRGSTGSAQTRHLVTSTRYPTSGQDTTPAVTTQLLEQDTFQRPDQTLWGSATDGSLWGGDAATSNDCSIARHMGKIGRAAAGNSLYTATLGVTHADAEIMVTLALDSFTNSHIGVILRYTNDNQYYKALLDRQGLRFLKRIDAQHGPMIGAKLPYIPQPQTPYTIRFRVSGHTLQAKVWPAGTAEPAAWMLTAEDNDAGFHSGLGGLRPQIMQGATLTVSLFQLYAVIR
jgi:serine/threonine protein kinase